MLHQLDEKRIERLERRVRYLAAALLRITDGDQDAHKVVVEMLESCGLDEGECEGFYYEAAHPHEKPAARR